MIEKTISADKLRKVIEDRSERDGKPVPRAMLKGLTLRQLSNISTAPADKRIEMARQYQHAEFGSAADEFGEGGSIDAEFKFGGKVARREAFPWHRLWENTKIDKAPKPYYQATANISDAQLKLIRDLMSFAEVGVKAERAVMSRFDGNCVVLNVDTSSDDNWINFALTRAQCRQILQFVNAFVPQVFGFTEDYNPYSGKAVYILMPYDENIFRPMQAIIRGKQRIPVKEMIEIKSHMREQALNMRGERGKAYNALSIDSSFPEFEVRSKVGRPAQEGAKSTFYAPAFALGGEIFSGDSPYFWMPSSTPSFEQGGNVSRYRYPAIPSVTLYLMTEFGLNMAKLDNVTLRNEIHNDRDALSFMNDYARQWAGDASSYHEAKKIIQKFDDRLAQKVAKAFGLPASDIPKRSEVEQRHKMWMSIKKNG